VTDSSRITEKDLYVPALRAMARRQNGYISTADLIDELRAELGPTGEDLEILDNRQDDRFSQKVRNIKSHKNTPGNIIHDGYAEDVPDGFQITDAGREFLRRQTG
jgi:hypothetical protein